MINQNLREQLVKELNHILDQMEQDDTEYAVVDVSVHGDMTDEEQQTTSVIHKSMFAQLSDGTWILEDRKSDKSTF